MTSRESPQVARPGPRRQHRQRRRRSRPPTRPPTAAVARPSVRPGPAVGSRSPRRLPGIRDQPVPSPAHDHPARVGEQSAPFDQFGLQVDRQGPWRLQVDGPDPPRSRRARCGRRGGSGSGTAGGRRSRYRRIPAPASPRGSGWPGRGFLACPWAAGQPDRGEGPGGQFGLGLQPAGARASPGTAGPGRNRSTACWRRATRASDSPLPPAVEPGCPTGTMVPRMPTSLSPSRRERTSCPTTAGRASPAVPGGGRSSSCRPPPPWAGPAFAGARRVTGRSFWVLRGWQYSCRTASALCGRGFKRLVDVPQPAAGVEEEDRASAWSDGTGRPRSHGGSDRGRGSGMAWLGNPVIPDVQTVDASRERK